MAASTQLFEANAVLDALSNPKYVWRTLLGLEQETKLPKEEILRVLYEMKDSSLVTARGRDGNPVYSTREHYMKNRSFLSKILTGLSGEIK